MIVYNCSMQTEFDAFSAHDTEVVGYFNDMAKYVNRLNSSWNDDQSNTFLTAFNSSILEMKNNLGKIHDEVARYLGEVQSKLNVWGQGSELALPNLGEVTIYDVTASANDGSFKLDDKELMSIINEMDATVSKATDCVNNFNPTPASLEGSDANIIASIQSNYDEAKKSYVTNLKAPFDDIKSCVLKIKEIYEPRIQAILNSSANA